MECDVRNVSSRIGYFPGQCSTFLKSKKTGPPTTTLLRSFPGFVTSLSETVPRLLPVHPCAVPPIPSLDRGGRYTSYWEPVSRGWTSAWNRHRSPFHCSSRFVRRHGRGSLKCRYHPPCRLPKSGWYQDLPRRVREIPALLQVPLSDEVSGPEVTSPPRRPLSGLFRLPHYRPDRGSLRRNGSSPKSFPLRTHHGMNSTYLNRIFLSSARIGNLKR